MKKILKEMIKLVSCFFGKHKWVFRTNGFKSWNVCENCGIEADENRLIK